MTGSFQGWGDKEPEPGSLGQLGEYHLLKKIAQGGMAEIFLATRFGAGGFEKTFVIKRMLDSLCGSQEFVTMFLDEARLAARLVHPNIAQIYDFGAVDARYYIAMEHIVGEDGRSVIQRLGDVRRELPLGFALRIVGDIAAGLHYAHTFSDDGKELGIIHRDVSPANIMISYQGAVKLLDFGVAKAAERFSETQAGSLKGKLSFLSPEQIAGLPLDGRADVFSLGICLYALLTRRHPFRRESELSTMHAITQETLPDPKLVRPDLPDDVVAILRRALARDRDQRYASAAQMGEAVNASLRRHAPGLGASDLAAFLLELFGKEVSAQRAHVPKLPEARRASLTAVSPVGKLVTLAEPAVAPPPGTPAVLAAPGGEDPTPRRPAVWWAMGVAAVALLGATAFSLLSGSGVAPAGGAATDSPAAGSARTSVAAAPVSATAAPLTPPAPPDPPPSPPAEPRGAEPTVAAAEPRRPRPARPLEPLDAATLESVVRRSHPRLTACFKQHEEVLPAAQGQVNVEVAVTGAGRVSFARAELPAPAAELARCLEKQARRLRFPRHPDEQLRFAFPLIYRKGG